MKALVVLAAWLTLPGIALPQPQRPHDGCLTDRYGNVACGPAASSCLKDRYGEVKCSTPGGGIVLDRYKTPVCGPGACRPDRYGDVVCSAVPAGATALDINGEVVCTEGCVKATAAACVVPAK
jgi:hypothetical protein